MINWLYSPRIAAIGPIGPIQMSSFFPATSLPPPIFQNTLSAKRATFSFFQQEEMADAILYGIVQMIIESLGSSILQPIRSIWGVKDELEKMKNIVLTIQAVLKDAEE